MDDNNHVPSAPELRVRIIGIGGAGTHALAQVARTELASVPMTALHTHARVLQHSAVPHRLLLGVDRTHGLGTGGDAALARVMAGNEAEKIREIVSGLNMVFLISGMGGGTGTGASPVVARLAKESGALVVALVTLPYEFEGLKRQKQALAGVQSLRAEADAVICVPNQKTSKLLDANTTVLDAFGYTNELLADAICGIYQMLTRPGLINVDFAYLSSILRGRHVESLLATARATGEHRARDVVERVLSSPLLEGGKALSGADQVLASVVASRNLTMAEINRITEQLGRHADPQQIVIGTALDESRPDFISLTVIAAKHAKVPVAALDVVEPAQAQSQRENTSFLDEEAAPRPAPRFVAPPPESTPEKTRHLLETQPNSRRKKSPWKQELLALEIVSRGRFEKSEPTIHRGADLDVPTYIRRGVPLN